MIGGAQLKLTATLSTPPLIIAMGGYRSGTSADVQAAVALKSLMDPPSFIAWIRDYVEFPMAQRPAR